MTVRSLCDRSPAATDNLSKPEYEPIWGFAIIMAHAHAMPSLTREEMIELLKSLESHRSVALP